MWLFRLPARWLIKGRSKNRTGLASSLQVHHVPLGKARHRKLDVASSLVLTARICERDSLAELEIGACEVDGLDRVVPDVVTQADVCLNRGRLCSIAPLVVECDQVDQVERVIRANLARHDLDTTSRVVHWLYI